MDTTNRQLMWHGMFLFLIGLITGLAEPHFANVRMGLAAHLEGLMNGMLLVALGAIWTEVKLTPRAKATAYWAAIYGTYVNWLLTALAATLGTAALSPVLAAGRSGGSAWQETLVTAGFFSVMLAMFVSTGLILSGLRARTLQRHGADDRTTLDRAQVLEGQ